MESRRDFSDGGECGGVGAGEATKGDVDALLLRLLDLIALDAGWNETGGNAGVGGAVGVVFSVDGEVQRVAVVFLAVDGDGCGCGHGLLG